VSLGQWLGLFCIVAALYILWQIRQILLLAFTAVVLAIALNILVRKLTRLGLPRGVAVLLTVLTSLLAAILFFWLIVPPFADQFQKVIELLPSGFLRIRDWADDFRTRLPPWVPDLPTLSNLQQQLQPSFVSLRFPKHLGHFCPGTAGLHSGNHAAGQPRQLSSSIPNFVSVVLSAAS
jgi:predicted PurR-regulated permease PerM